MLRDFTVENGIITPLLELVKNNIHQNGENVNQSNSFMRNITWTISNLCRNKNPSPTLQVVRALLPTLYQLTMHGDNEVLGELPTYLLLLNKYNHYFTDLLRLQEKY